MNFSIRDLMWLTVVVALVLGWWVNRSGLHSLLVQEVHKREEAEKGRRIADERFTKAKYYLESQGYDVPVWGEGGVAFGNKRGKLPTSQAPAPNPKP